MALLGLAFLSMAAWAFFGNRHNPVEALFWSTLALPWPLVVIFLAWHFAQLPKGR
jgi:hypothetical protein